MRLYFVNFCRNMFRPRRVITRPTLTKHLKIYTVAFAKMRLHFLQLRYVLFYILFMLLLS